jgi:hypothetical protein
VGSILLPGGVAGGAQGFAVSAGTQHPEQAYALVKFLSGNVQVVSQFFGDSPARQRSSAESEDDQGSFSSCREEVDMLRDQALVTALPRKCVS